MKTLAMILFLLISVIFFVYHDRKQRKNINILTLSKIAKAIIVVNKLLEIQKDTIKINDEDIINQAVEFYSLKKNKPEIFQLVFENIQTVDQEEKMLIAYGLNLVDQMNVDVIHLNDANLIEKLYKYYKAYKHSKSEEKTPT